MFTAILTGLFYFVMAVAFMLIPIMLIADVLVFISGAIDDLMSFIAWLLMIAFTVFLFWVVSFMF